MIRSISVDKFGAIDALDLKLDNLYHVEKSSGGDSLLTLLLAMKQSCVPGYLHDWQLHRRPGENCFGGGRLEVNGRLFDGGSFAASVHEGSPYCSLSLEFVLENPEKPVLPEEEECACQTGGRAGAGSTAYTEKKQAGPGGAAYTDKKRAGADDFRELCRLYGEKFVNVSRFAVGAEVTFAKRGDDNILSYQLVSVKCERVWDEDIASFFELVVYKNGANYELYWDELPDVGGVRQSGRAKGCNVRMRDLQIRNIVSDGVQDGARLCEVLPGIVMISRIAAEQFETVQFLDLAEAVRPERRLAREGWPKDSPSPDDLACRENNRNLRTENHAYVHGPCYYVGLHGEYLADVIETYIGGKLKIAWPDPVTGEIRHGFFAEAYEVWREAAGIMDRMDSRCESDRPMRSRNACQAENLGILPVLVQGLIMRTGETLIIRAGACHLPERFLVSLARMGRQIVIV